MSRWQREVLAIGLSADTMAGAAESAPAPAGGWSVQALQTAFHGLRSASSGQTMRLLLCPDLCRHFVQPPSTGLRSLSELRVLATLRAGQLFGGPPQAWTVVADWSLTQPVVCAAMPSTLLDSLRQAAQQLGLVLRVESAALAGLAGLSRLPPLWERVQGFVAWVSPAYLMLAAVTAGAVKGLRCIHRQPDAGPADLAARAVREAAQDTLRSAVEVTQPQSAPLLFAWSGVATMPTASHGAYEAIDAASVLPAVQGAESDAAWACRLASLS